MHARVSRGEACARFKLQRARSAAGGSGPLTLGERVPVLDGVCDADAVWLSDAVLEGVLVAVVLDDAAAAGRAEQGVWDGAWVRSVWNRAWRSDVSAIGEPSRPRSGDTTTHP